MSMSILRRALLKVNKLLTTIHKVSLSSEVSHQLFNQSHIPMYL